MSTSEKCAHGWEARLGCAGCVRRVRAEYPEFPLQMTRDQRTKPGPLSVPWAVADKAWVAYHQRYGSGQSVERLAQRGGFDWAEMDMFLPDWREATDAWRMLAEENARLREQVAAGERGRSASARAVMRASYVYDKTRPKGQQGVARIEGAVGEDGSAVVMFGCQRADKEGKVCWLSKQHAIEFASSMLMIALSLPGDIPAGDMSMAAEDWPIEPESEVSP